MPALRDLYPLPDIDPHWSVPQEFSAVFDWTFDEGRNTLMHLYQKGKDMQWDAVNRIDWSLELDPDDPCQFPEEVGALYGSDIWRKMTRKEQNQFKLHSQAWQISQFFQGEQAALLCASKIVQQVPDLDAKFYGATQVMDEARHVEAYKKLLEKFGVAYPMTGPLQSLVDDAMRDSRWDVTYLAMQVVIEGLALAAFGTIRDMAQNPLVQQVNAYVMEDEARHVAFGRLSLRDYYPQLTDAERAEREDFLIEACWHMRDRFQAKEVYETLGLPVQDCLDWQEKSEIMQLYRAMLFQRIVPIVKDIGLWSEKVQKTFAEMGVLHYKDLKIEDLQADDEAKAQEFDARRAYVESVARATTAAAE